MPNVTFTLEVIKEELLEFESLFEDAESFTDYRLNEIGTAIKDFRDDWNLEKRRRFCVWFFLKGLSEHWLIDEVGGV